jgi:hypothetical protein
MIIVRFKVQGSGFKVQGSRFMVKVSIDQAIGVSEAVKKRETFSISLFLTIAYSLMPLPEPQCIPNY